MNGIEPRRRFPVCMAVCLGLIALGTSPVLLSWAPSPTVSFFKERPGWMIVGLVSLGVVIAGVVFATGRLDPEQGWAKRARYAGFIMLAALLTDLHFHTVDVLHMDWQNQQFLDILMHRCQPPHQYRFLPQGILWWMLLGNGNFALSYLGYRFLFTFLTCQSIYAFARQYLTPHNAIIVVLFYALFYPLSTRYYFGNLLDPMSHAVILAALTRSQGGRFGPFFWLFTLGMFIKETMLLIIPVYYLANVKVARLWDRRLLWRLALLTVSGLAVFLACRIPFRFAYGFETLNGTSELMVYSNLGLARGQAFSPVSVFQRHLHPFLFIFAWLPLIIWRRKLLPPSLFWPALYLAVASYLTNLCFGWNYESRNFVPALILLLVSTMVVVNRLVGMTAAVARVRCVR
jgi:hypothetical protein